jgi:hypothetical protein
MSANPNRKMPYAVRTPNAIEPAAAQTNIIRLNTSAIFLDPQIKATGEIPHIFYRPASRSPPQLVSWIVSENLVSLTLVSIGK